MSKRNKKSQSQSQSQSPPSRTINHPPLIHEISIGPLALFTMDEAQKEVGSSCEVGGILIPHPSDPFTFVDCLIPAQTATPGTVNFDPDSYGDLTCEPPDLWSKWFPNGFVPVWWHSHHNMQPSPSGTDYDTFGDTYGFTPYSIMLITSNTNGDHCLLRTNLTPTDAIHINITAKRLPYAYDLLIPPWHEGKSLEALLSEKRKTIRENLNPVSLRNKSRLAGILKVCRQGTIPLKNLEVFTSTLSTPELEVFGWHLLRLFENPVASLQARLLWLTYDGIRNPDDEDMIHSLCESLAINPDLDTWLQPLSIAFNGEVPESLLPYSQRSWNQSNHQSYGQWNGGDYTPPRQQATNLLNSQGQPIRFPLENPTFYGHE